MKTLLQFSQSHSCNTQYYPLRTQISIQRVHRKLYLPGWLFLLPQELCRFWRWRPGWFVQHFYCFTPSIKRLVAWGRWWFCRPYCGEKLGYIDTSSRKAAKLNTSVSVAANTVKHINVALLHALHKITTKIKTVM
jgi:hypothetical protein